MTQASGIYKSWKKDLCCWGNSKMQLMKSGLCDYSNRDFHIARATPLATSDNHSVRCAVRIAFIGAGKRDSGCDKRLRANHAQAESHNAMTKAR
jgi:hypothetical protein